MALMLVVFFMTIHCVFGFGFLAKCRSTFGLAHVRTIRLNLDRIQPHFSGAVGLSWGRGAHVRSLALSRPWDVRIIEGADPRMPLGHWPLFGVEGDRSGHLQQGKVTPQGALGELSPVELGLSVGTSWWFEGGGAVVFCGGVPPVCARLWGSV